MSKKVETNCNDCVFATYGLSTYSRDTQIGCLLDRIDKYKKQTKVEHVNNELYRLNYKIDNRICVAKRGKEWKERQETLCNDIKAAVLTEIKINYDLVIDVVLEDLEELKAAISLGLHQAIKPRKLHILCDSSHRSLTADKILPLINKYDIPINLEWFVNKTNIYDRENIIVRKITSPIYVWTTATIPLPTNLSIILNTYINRELMSFAYINSNIDPFFIGSSSLFCMVGGNNKEQSAIEKFDILRIEQNCPHILTNWNQVVKKCQ